MVLLNTGAQGRGQTWTQLLLGTRKRVLQKTDGISSAGGDRFSFRDI